MHAGLLKGAQLGQAAPWRIQVTPDDITRLMPSEVPDGWASLNTAARVLGLSRQGVGEPTGTAPVLDPNFRGGDEDVGIMRSPVRA